eukprot:TRINITY_DN125_c0_g2_i2.p1 TRINITY_DN125_c0_g2~~TRINITY_DN125_c0_g2_i2.p1  ORF type:complete len:725 (-),score=170.04 TRINITY_DN125_c0_g2_i2:86-2131(-)
MSVKNDLLVTQLYGLNKSFNINSRQLANNEPMFLKNVKKKALILPRKNISDSAIDYNGDLDLTISGTTSYNQRVIKKSGVQSQTPAKQARDRSVLTFYSPCLKEITSFKSSIKDSLLACLQEKLKEKLEAERSKRAFSEAVQLPKQDKLVFYKTQARDTFWQRERKEKSEGSFNTAHSNEPMLMPLATQMQCIQRNCKNVTQTPNKFQKTGYRAKIMEMVGANKARSDRKCLNNSVFLKGNNRGNKLKINEFRLFKMNVTKNFFGFGSQENSINYRKPPKRLVIKKNTDPTISVCHLGILSRERPRTSKLCHRTKRILYCPRANTGHYPLLILNFEGVLGEVYQDSFSDQGKVFYVVKPRTFALMVELGACLKQLMRSYRVVLHFYISSKLFKVFYDFLKNEGVRVDGIYQARTSSHGYYQDYSQILLDFSIGSHEALGKRVLFVASLEQRYEDSSELTFMDKAVINPDMGALCKGVPIIYGITGIAKKHKIPFQSSHNSYYEAITLLVPSIQFQDKSISIPSLIKAINLLAVDKSFLEGIKSHFKSAKMQEAFDMVETEVFWERFAEQKGEKRRQAKWLERLNESAKAKEVFKCDPMDNTDPAKTFIYMQLVELNSKLQETTNTNVKYEASFSDEEFDKEAQSESSQFRSNIFAIPNPKFFEGTELECISIQSSAPHHKH